MFFDDIHAKTGWCFHIQGGGPQVATPNAPIKYTSYSVGFMDGNETFETWAKKEGVWKDHWKPFSAFVHQLFREYSYRFIVSIPLTCRPPAERV
jgi:hypothetical protein